MASTQLNPSEISELIKSRIEKVKLSAESRNEGTVTSSIRARLYPVLLASQASAASLFSARCSISMPSPMLWTTRA